MTTKLKLPIEIDRPKSDYHYMYVNAHIANKTTINNLIHLFKSPLWFLADIAFVASAQLFAYDFLRVRYIDKWMYFSRQSATDDTPRPLYDPKFVVAPELSYIHGNIVNSVLDGEVVLKFNYMEDDYNYISHFFIRPLVNIFLDNFLALGNFIIIKHDTFLYSVYAHLKNNSIKVKVGDTVKAGQHIASVGNTGSSIASHLHFSMVRLPIPYTGINIPVKTEFEPHYEATLNNKDASKLLDFIKISSYYSSYEMILPEKINYKKVDGDFKGLYGLVTDKR